MKIIFICKSKAVTINVAAILMFIINYKQIYEVEHKENNEWVLILYDISANHYVGTPIYSKNNVDLVHLESIDKYINPSIVRDYDRSHMKKCIYVNGKPLKISNEDFRINCKDIIIILKHRLEYYFYLYIVQSN